MARARLGAEVEYLSKTFGARMPGPMTIGKGEKILDCLRGVRPELFDGGIPDGCLRGVDIYDRAVLLAVFGFACNLFFGVHGRLPDLFDLPRTADHFFALKFFHPMPIDPNPGDKLGCHSFVPSQWASRIRSPDRCWVSETPAIPLDDEVPPGTYRLKMSNGNAMQKILSWPPTAADRQRLARMIGPWWRMPYGVTWGEWWYGLVKPRLFLERDLSGEMGGRPEVKIFVREGEVKLFYLVRYRSDKRHEKTYFDSGLRPLPGREPNYQPLDAVPPANIGLMMEAAAAIGRRFRLVRVDFLDVGDSPPYLGELTLCPANARRVILPLEVDGVVRRLLFD